MLCNLANDLTTSQFLSWKELASTSTQEHLHNESPFMKKFVIVRVDHMRQPQPNLRDRTSCQLTFLALSMKCRTPPRKRAEIKCHAPSRWQLRQQNPPLTLPYAGWFMMRHQAAWGFHSCFRRLTMMKVVPMAVI